MNTDRFVSIKCFWFMEGFTHHKPRAEPRLLWPLSDRKEQDGIFPLVILSVPKKYKEKWDDEIDAQLQRKETLKGQTQLCKESVWDVNRLFKIQWHLMCMFVPVFDVPVVSHISAGSSEHIHIPGCSRWHSIASHAHDVSITTCH